MRRGIKRTIPIREFEQYKRERYVRNAPKYRGECCNIPRPCPFVGCKYSMFLDVTEAGSIVLNFGTDDPLLIPPECSCMLDLVGDGNPMTLEEIGIIMNLTKERVRQIQEAALVKLRILEVDWEMFPLHEYGPRLMKFFF